MTNACGPPLTVAVMGWLEQVSVNQGSATLTASVKVTPRSRSMACEAPLAGTVMLTAGALSGALHGLAAVAVLRGFGVAAVKSLPFTSVSEQPVLLRSAAVMADSLGAGVPSKKFAWP